jgi:myb proto-oncogene protein
MHHASTVPVPAVSASAVSVVPAAHEESFLEFIGHCHKVAVPETTPPTAEGVASGRRWLPEEDAALTAAVAKYGARRWKVVASEVSSRDHVQCAQRWLKALRPGLHKGHWKPEEDQTLRNLVQEHGTNWPKVEQNWILAGDLKMRTVKQIRERWCNHVNPAISRDRFTPEEDRMLLELQEIWGNSWSKIAKSLPGRVGETVKSRYKTLLRRKKQKLIGSPAPNRGGTATGTMDAITKAASILQTSFVAKDEGHKQAVTKGGSLLAALAAEACNTCSTSVGISHQSTDSGSINGSGNGNHGIKSEPIEPQEGKRLRKTPETPGETGSDVGRYRGGVGDEKSSPKKRKLCAK